MQSQDITGASVGYLRRKTAEAAVSAPLSFQVFHFANLLSAGKLPAISGQKASRPMCAINRSASTEQAAISLAPPMASQAIGDEESLSPVANQQRLLEY